MSHAPRPFPRGTRRARRRPAGGSVARGPRGRAPRRPRRRAASARATGRAGARGVRRERRSHRGRAQARGELPAIADPRRGGQIAAARGGGRRKRVCALLRARAAGAGRASDFGHAAAPTTATAPPDAGRHRRGLARRPLPAPAGSPGDLPTALLRSSPADFVVEELPAYTPSGRGEHVFVTFRKTGRTTPDAVRAIALALGADPGSAGFAGMKDRHAITTQTASFQLPLARDPAPLLGEGRSCPGSRSSRSPATTTSSSRGTSSATGSGSRSGASPPRRSRSPSAASPRSGRTGVPNAFGPQRFGRNGDNPERALAWISGRERGPRDKREQRLLFSALQSLWFNEVLARREADGTWSAVLPGDLAKKRDSGGLFLVPLEGPELADAEARAAALAISATGPMFGRKMRWPEGAPGALEREVLTAAIGDPRKARRVRPRRRRHAAPAAPGGGRPRGVRHGGNRRGRSGESHHARSRGRSGCTARNRRLVCATEGRLRDDRPWASLPARRRLRPRPPIGRPGAASAPPPEEDEVEEGQPAVDP